MPKTRRPHDPDPNSSIARAVRATAATDDELPADVEAAWSAWIDRIQRVDERTKTLLRAAFEAGHAAGSSSAAKGLGRRGGLKGGKARAQSLSKRRLSEIGRTAARARWKPTTAKSYDSSSSSSSP
jgi:hypothetical protein